MISKYVNGQASIYNTLVNQNINNKLSHAYLIDASGNANAINIVKDFCKFLMCPKKIVDKCCDDTCDICYNFDNSLCNEFKLIDSDGLWIKKEQILDLQNDFSKKSTEGLKKIYVITEAAKLNQSSANTLLKFLEEPDDNIIAFLITNNVNLVLETIKSRCQFIKLNANVLDGLEKIDNIDKLFEFAYFLEEKGNRTIIYEKEKWLNYFSNRNDCYNALNVLVNVYNLILKYKLGYLTNIDEDYRSFFDKIVSLNTVDKLVSKLLSLVKYCDDVKKNVNINLLIDNLIFSFGGE